MIYYNSWDINCKKPFGAVIVGNTVNFTVFSDNCFKGFLIINNEEIEMTLDKNTFSVSYTFEAYGTYFYCFKLISNNLFEIFIGKGGSDNHSFSTTLPQSLYQITVAQPMPELPAWYTEGIMYQIFPDRFNRALPVTGIKPNSFMYESWDTLPQYIKTETGDIEKWDFYGGNLKGIEEKLDYLKSLNVTVLYLNPIFEASSNHRYNTADYHKIDSMLGSYEDFLSLVEACRKKGIHIILDGVFNHVGADSIYFNRFSKYDSIGAYNSTASDYYNWFTFDEHPNSYLDWWGVSDLPKLNTEYEGVRDFLITSQNSVVKKWINTGIGGFRLDVADELSDEFLKLLNHTVKSQNQDTVIIGEVWEDASNKISYGVLKKYFTDGELDCVMNYPIRDNLIDFFFGVINAKTLKNRFMTQLENYPKRNYMGNFNLISTHDVERILTICKTISKTAFFSILEQFVASLFIFPGVPCIYYGDEAGLEGGKDPDNRRTYPWGKENNEILSVYKKYSSFRNENAVLKTGKTYYEYVNDHIFLVVRECANKKILLYLSNTPSSLDFECPITGKKLHMEGFSCKVEIFC